MSTVPSADHQPTVGGEAGAVATLSVAASLRLEFGIRRALVQADDTETGRCKRLMAGREMMQAQVTRGWCRRPDKRTYAGVTFPIGRTGVDVGDGLPNKIVQADGCIYLGGCGRFTKRYVS